jgi:cell wall assembly regulator SMI1
MDWKDLVIRATREPSGEPRFQSGATEAQLTDAERRIGVRIPESLRSLLTRCDGIMDRVEIHNELIETQWLVWPTEIIIERNIDPRRSDTGMPPSWFLFATADGRDFGFDLEADDDRIWVWDPIDNEKELIAPTFQEFLLRWVGGEVRL